MHPIATNVVWSVLCVCLFVSHNCESCKNGLTDRDTIWNVDSWGPKESVLDDAHFGAMQPGVSITVGTCPIDHCHHVSGSAFSIKYVTPVAHCIPFTPAESV